MKTILIDGFYLGRGRGVGNYIENLLNELRYLISSELRVVVVCRRDAVSNRESVPNLTLFYVPAFPFPVWENFLIPALSWFFKADKVHSPSNSSPLPPVHGRRLVTVHDTIFCHPESLVPRSRVLRQRVGRWYLRFNAYFNSGRYSKVMTVSNASKRDIASLLCVPIEKISVVYEGPGIIFNESPKLLANRRVVIHFASNDPRKNTGRCIDAFQRSGIWRYGYMLHLIGGVKLGLRIPDAIRGSVVCHQFLPLAELQRIVDEASVLLYPSLYEGFGMPIVEFQRVGVPVITSVTSACGEIAGDGAVLVDPASIEDISDGLTRLCGDSIFAESVSRRAKINAARFSWERCARAVIEEYLEA
jgi:glycosyltransferase involved in cell wall biosynthesis